MLSYTQENTTSLGMQNVATDARINAAEALRVEAVASVGAYQYILTPMEEVVDQLELLGRRGEWKAAERLLRSNVLVAFYGLEPDRLYQLLKGIIDAGADRFHTAQTVLMFLPRQGPGSTGAQMMAPSNSTSSLYFVLRKLGQAIAMRLHGYAHDTSEILDEIDASFASVAPTLDPAAGWALMIPVQCGVTAMLAGDFKRALTYFAAAQMHPYISSLAFLTRDAYVKSALIYALFGNALEAARNLESAAEISRGCSWIEPVIDANVAQVEALLTSGSHDVAVNILDSIPLHLLGEMWPFHVFAMQRVFDQAERLREFSDRVVLFEKSPLPRVSGSGFTGSVLATARAFISLRKGDTETARRWIDDTDPRCVIAQGTKGFIELSAGRILQALDVGQKIGADPHSAGLRLVELWRYSILAAAYRERGGEEQAREALLAVMKISGGLQAEDAVCFDDALLRFACEQIEEWPIVLRPDCAGAAYVTEPSIRLTAREFEIVRLLAGRSSQQQIAKRLFISVNTLKTHLQAIYRKLNVTSREAAVLRAEQESWL